MRCALTSLFILAALALPPAAAAAGGGSGASAIPWETSLDRGRATALRTNQPLLVEFWAVWCPGCEDMDREVYGDERVAAAMRQVTPVRIDIDRDPLLARRYEVSATPTLVLMDAYGNELFRFTGTLSRDRVLQLLADTPTDISRLNALAAKIAANKDDFAALAAMGHELRA